MPTEKVHIMIKRWTKRISAVDFVLFIGIINLRQHRIIIFVRLRSQIFRQIVQKRRRRADARQVDFVRYDGKYASKRTEKALAVNCAVLP